MRSTGLAKVFLRDLDTRWIIITLPDYRIYYVTGHVIEIYTTRRTGIIWIAVPDQCDLYLPVRWDSYKDLGRTVGLQNIAPCHSLLSIIPHCLNVFPRFGLPGIHGMVLFVGGSAAYRVRTASRPISSFSSRKPMRRFVPTSP